MPYNCYMTLGVGQSTCRPSGVASTLTRAQRRGPGPRRGPLGAPCQRAALEPFLGVLTPWWHLADPEGAEEADREGAEEADLARLLHPTTAELSFGSYRVCPACGIVENRARSSSLSTLPVGLMGKESTVFT